jgi:uncharacterized membrane protein YkvA (DUF1232 family)
MRLLRLLVAAKAAIFRTVPLVRDARVPLSLKVVAALIGLLIISPLDLFGDIPVLGALDDAALLTLLCVWFVSRAAFDKHEADLLLRCVLAVVVFRRPRVG